MTAPLQRTSPWISACRRLLSRVGAMACVGLAMAAAQAAPAPGGTTLRVVAQAIYVPAESAHTETIYSNTAALLIESVEAVQLTGDQTVVLPPGAPVSLHHQLVNAGNVASSYRLSWRVGGSQCPASAAVALSGLRVVVDGNANGAADAQESPVPLDTAAALTLRPGESVTLLAQGALPVVAAGTACVTLTIATDTQGVRASSRSLIDVGDIAWLTLLQSARYADPLRSGSSVIDYQLQGVNIGSQDARPTAQTAGGAVILVNRAVAQLVLVRAVVPTGVQYVAGSLQSSLPGAIRLFRLPGDAAFSYRTEADDASAIEVAIGLPATAGLAPTVAYDMRWSGLVTAPSSQARIEGAADVHFHNGNRAAVTVSNTTAIPLLPARLGVAQWAGVPQSRADGTLDVPLAVRVKNYGAYWLYDLQLDNLLEGAEPDQFGSYTTAAVPGPGQYTLVPGSLRIDTSAGGIGGQVAAVQAAFNGTRGSSGLLAPGAVLPLSGDLTVRFVVRFHPAGHSAQLFNSTKASAATYPGGPARVVDASVDGSDPDPDRDGDPGNNASSTPVSSTLPVLTLSKTIPSVRYVSAGVFDVDFLVRVSNLGTADASHLRVIDNLSCAFGTDLADAPIASWALHGPVRTGSGILQPSSRFTGRASCDRNAWQSGDPAEFPTEASLSLTDGSRSLPVGQTEQVGFTVRVTLKASAIGSRTTFTNKAWAVALSDNTTGVPSGQVLGASAAAAVGALIDPQGIVYDAVSRQPVSGALVTVKRLSCDGATPATISADQVFDGDNPRYVYNADGSLSMLTGSDGGWQFFWRSPPVVGKCSYGLSVTPPSGSGYVFPSQRMPPASEPFTRCGAVVPNPLAPADGEPTTYHTRVSSGLNADGSACEVLHNHIPLDPGLQNGLVLRKTAAKSQVEFGDFLDYALTLTNKTGITVAQLQFDDRLPAGFTYLPGSSRLNGAAVADPLRTADNRLTWQFPEATLSADKVAVVRYRVRVGVGARIAGTATNRAQAQAKDFQSNSAEHTVRVNGGVFADEAFAFGKVHLDCRRDGQQAGDDEPGVPGVRLWLENGTQVVTDGEGRWSLYGLRPLTHVLRLDETTLPPGATPVLQDHRNAGAASSRFLDLKRGELHKANFPLAGCEDEGVQADVQRRRAQAASQLDTELAAALRSRLDVQPQVAQRFDGRGMPAAGQINGSGAAGTSGVLAQAGGALIDLSVGPRTGASADAFLDAGAGVGTTGTLGMARQTPSAARAAVAAGRATTPGATPDTAAATATPRQPAGLTQGLVPQPAAASPIDLEALLPQLDKTAGFIDLRDGDTMPGPVTNVRVKGPAGTLLQLWVNDEVISGRRVGKKATLPSTGATAWEYIGLPLKPGLNRLRLQVVDELGIPREQPVELSVTAPDKLGAVRLNVPVGARADMRTPVAVIVELTDAAGVPVTARTAITLEADAGRWVEDDLNRQEPGLQAFVQGGRGVFHLLPPGVAGDVALRVTANGLVQDARLALLPELRPMMAVGIVEGTLDLTRRGRLAVDQLPAGAAFEDELTNLRSGSEDRRAGGRTAFFLKGAIRGDLLLTAAYDSGKSAQDRLLRDIRPDEFYPLYGDASERGYDAQSAQKLYVRIDKDRSYLLYGDFSTTSSAEVRKLSQTSRTLSGVKAVHEDASRRVTAYASRTSQSQQIVEFAGLGISGPYYLGAGLGDIVEGSETVELVSRTGNAAGAILKRTPLTRFVDYTFEPSLGRLMFINPVASADADLNPQFVRVTLEVDAGGPSYTVAGVDAQLKVGEQVQAGVVAHVDDDPRNPRRLSGVTGLARLGDHTSLATEAVRTHSSDKGDGAAARVEVRHQVQDFGFSAQAARASAAFDNPAAGFSAGSTEASLRAEYRLDASLAARAEARYAVTGGSAEAARGQSVALLKRFGPQLSGEIGLRHGAASGSTGLFSQEAGQGLGVSSLGNSVTSLGSQASSGSLSASENDQVTVRSRLTATLPGMPQAQVFAEAEQDTRDSHRRRAALGGSYAITDKTRLYGRYELTSTLYDDSNQQRNVGLFGVESNYMQGGRLYNEYRMADAATDRSAQMASGVRHTFRLGERWQVTGGIERSRNLSGGSSTGTQASATAITSGVEYSDGSLRATGVLEGRRGSDADTVLHSLGVGYRLGPDWSLLARSTFNSSRGTGAAEGRERVQARQQLGAAYRPADNDRWNALARYEHRAERLRGDITGSGSLSGNVFGSDAGLPGDYEAHIVSLHAHYSLLAGSTLSGRVAFKRATFDDGELKSRSTARLLYGRWTRDFGSRWDAGLQGGVLHGSGVLQKSVGIEVGYLVARDLWFSVGFNAIGLSDRDLTAGEYTSKGLYARLRLKFDETGLGFERSGPPRAALPAATVDKKGSAHAPLEGR